MEIKVMDMGIIITAMGVLVILTDALTQLFKSMFAKLPAQITATIIALVLTVCAVCAYVSINNIPMQWYIVVGAIIAGFFVSYTAQFGYDKLNEIIELLGLKKKKNESEDNDADKGN